MKKKILIRDVTLRDGQQSAFATRMTQAQIDRVLPYYRNANFYAMEVWGGAVPDAVMRYLNENPWHRLEKIKAGVGDASKLTALSRGRNLYGYAPYPDEIIDGFFKNAVSSGLDIMRIFDALNDIDNIASSVRSIQKYGGMADCAVCYTVDPKFDDSSQPEKKKGGFFSALFGKKHAENSNFTPVFTNDYFINKAREMVSLGTDMITIKDMSGLIPPSRIAQLSKLFTTQFDVPLDFHTHCTPGFGLAAVISAMVNDADIVDTSIWYFAGGTAAPAIELVYLFCKKLKVEMDVDMEAVGKIRDELYHIRKELNAFDTSERFPSPFDPLKDEVPAEVEQNLDIAIEAALRDDEEALLRACHAIEAYFHFPKPNELVKKAEIPGGMYSNMVAQLKQYKSLDILDDAMKLIPSVRLDAGLVPLVTPTSQIVGAQAVNSALNIRNGRDKYANPSNQFIALVKGEYGKTPIPIKPEFRMQIAGVSEETPYDTSGYQHKENPMLPEFGNVRLAKDEKEQLLLELFPLVAKNFLKNQREKEFNEQRDSAEQQFVYEKAKATEQQEDTVKGLSIPSPLPGTIINVQVKEGQQVNVGDCLVVLEAMKMENNITSDFAGTVRKIFVKSGDTVREGAALVELIQQ